MKKTDPRVRRTRLLLQEALKELLVEQRLEQVTVSAIVKRAEVARTTFYAHFETKEDLYASLREPIDAALLGEFESQVAGGAIDDERLALSLFSAMAEHVEVLQLLSGPSRDLFLFDQTNSLVADVSSRGEDLGIFDGESMDPYLLDALSGVLFMLTRRWLNTGRDVPLAEVAHIFAAYGALTRELQDLC